MTVLGKILVFVNLIFSLLTAGLIVMVYTTRINWHKAYQDQKAAVSVVQKDLQTAEEAQKQAIDRKDAEYQQLMAVKNRLESEGKAQAEQLAKTKADYERIASTQTQGQKVSADLLNELERRKAEVETLKKNVNEQDKKIADIDRQMARLRDESVQYRIQWEQTKDRLRLAQEQVTSLTQENGRLQAQLGGGATTGITPATGAAPRIEDLRGTIQKVDTATGLVTMTPGSDAGVVVGGKLQVYRLQPRPEYLGELTILAVSPTEAVGRLSGSKRTQVKKGDEVAANVLGR
jgi:hypothetical protein